MPINENSVYTPRFNTVMLPEERAMLQALQILQELDRLFNARKIAR